MCSVRQRPGIGTCLSEEKGKKFTADKNNQPPHFIPNPFNERLYLEKLEKGGEQ
jgi:hypothetical protein